MKKIIFGLMLSFVGLAVSAQQKDSSKTSGLGAILKKADEILYSSKTISGSSLTNDEIIAGLKEALSIGAQNSTGKLSVVDGFLKDAAVKILMPEELRQLETSLRAMGMNKIVDDAIVS